MMWALFVRKNIKNGQYEVSRSPFSTTSNTSSSTTPGKTGYQPTQEELKADAMIRSATFAPTKNAKIIKV